MGIMPLQLPQTMSLTDLHLSGGETITVGFADNTQNKQFTPNQLLQLTIHAHTGSDSNMPVMVPVTLNINNDLELNYFLAGGVLP